MRSIKFTAAFAASVLATQLAQAGMYKIGKYTFDENNAVRTAAIVEGPMTMFDYSNKRFGRFSTNYIGALETRVNEFAHFNRAASVGRLLDRPANSDRARHISFAEPGDTVPMANVHRNTIELTWAGAALPNKAGFDFVVFESGEPEAYTVSVRKAGSTEFTRPRFHFADSQDNLHNANTTAFDLSNFGLAEGETITAIRIRNVFNSQARQGPDKVDNASGEGAIVYPGEPQYKKAYPLLLKSGGKEPKTEQLGADIIYVVGLHDVIATKTTAQAPGEETPLQTADTTK